MQSHGKWVKSIRRTVSPTANLTAGSVQKRNGMDHGMEVRKKIKDGGEAPYSHSLIINQ